MDKLTGLVNCRRARITITYEDAAEILKELDRLEVTIEVYKEREKLRHEQDAQALKELQAEVEKLRPPLKYMGTPFSVGNLCPKCGMMLSANSIHLCNGSQGISTIIGELGGETK
jgi:hypothetical protein